MILSFFILAMGAVEAELPPLFWLEATPLFSSEAPAVVVEPAVGPVFDERNFEPGLWLAAHLPTSIGPTAAMVFYAALLAAMTSEYVEKTPMFDQPPGTASRSPARASPFAPTPSALP